jgi:hypothetical protein
MAFSIDRPNISQTIAFGDDDVYEFSSDGVLTVTVRGGKTTTHYSPNAWNYVTTDNGHKPGNSGRPNFRAAMPQVGTSDDFNPMTAQF